MSDTITQPRLWTIYVQDMIRYAETALTYTRGMDLATFLNDNKIYHATLWNIERIGGAATQVPAPVREAYPHVQWGKFMETQRPERLPPFQIKRRRNLGDPSDLPPNPRPSTARAPVKRRIFSNT